MNQAAAETSGEKKAGGLELRAALSLSLCGKINDRQFFCFFHSFFSLLMWSINIQPGTHQCHALSLESLHWITPLGAQNINLCGQCASHVSHLPHYLEPCSILRNADDHSSLCCPSHHSFTKSAMCTLRTLDSVALVWCCVFCLERKVAIKFTSCWVRCCQAHTHTTESPVCCLSSALILFIFLACGMKRKGGNESRSLSVKGRLDSSYDSGCFTPVSMQICDYRDSVGI